jgi:DNA-binding CsgD family transcriptional regulator
MVPETEWVPSASQLDLLERLARGESLTASSLALGVSERTLRRRLADVRRAAGTSTLVQTVAWAVRRGWV